MSAIKYNLFGKLTKEERIIILEYVKSFVHEKSFIPLNYGYMNEGKRLALKYNIVREVKKKDKHTGSCYVTNRVVLTEEAQEFFKFLLL